MGLATRLNLGLAAVIFVVMLIYGVMTLRDRQAFAGASLTRETAALAQTIQIVANSAVRNGRVDNLDRVLQRTLQNSGIVLNVAVDSAGRIIAGQRSERTACIPRLLATAGAARTYAGWEECGGRVRVIVLPLERPAAALVLAQGTGLLDEEASRARWQILMTALTLALLASLATVLVLRLTLTRPLSGILSGVRKLGGPALPETIQAPESPGELRELAGAFNEMVERLEGKRRSLIREVEDRIVLERRLRNAEVFAAIGRLSGGLAHEIGSPLGVIGVRAEAIEGDPGANARAREHAVEISVQVERIAGLVRDLMHVARRHGVEPEPVDLRAVIQAVADSIRDDPNAADVAVDLRLGPSPVVVKGDPVLLRHALNNVVVNALQALREVKGGKRLTLGISGDNGTTRLSVEDNGPGIDPEHEPFVLQPFFTTKEVGRGSGLGLAITAGILAEHGGTLTFDSSPGAGARFYLDLPGSPPGEKSRA